MTNILNFCGALREMSVNFMRVTRGAGNPEELIAQAMVVVAEYEALRAAGLKPKVDDIRAALAIAKPHDQGLVPAQESFIEASLRIAAARQDGNWLQESAGEKDMLNAMRSHDMIIKGEL